MNCFNMYGIIVGVLILALTIQTESVLTEHEQFPESEPATNRDLLTQLINIIEEQARRRLQQQHRQQQLHRDHLSTEEISGPGFTYQLPINYPSPTDNDVPFAVGPSDPRFYENNAMNINNPTYYNLPNNINNNNRHDNEPPVRFSSDGVPSYKVRAPMDVRPKFNDNNGYPFSKSKDVVYREDLNSMEMKKKMQENAYPNDVSKKHMEVDATMGMYVIALIAGVSAAVTVGLLAIGIGWYTLQKKAKAAADVDYPAYGVTGPNKDISPSSGDRRLAQSAQMYHYQHQKQQIIQQMGGQNANDQNGTISDIETDEENEEGDYTVYECPGLAPTGDMEVKNPLFLDDPTPATATSTSANDQSQPQQEQQSNDKPTNTEPATKK